MSSPTSASNRFIYTVYDLTAKRMTQALFMESHDAPAIRDFHDALANEKSPFALHPAEYDLVVLGMINDQGNLFAQEPYTVAKGADWLNRKENK